MYIYTHVYTIYIYNIICNTYIVHILTYMYIPMIFPIYPHISPSVSDASELPGQRERAAAPRGAAVGAVDGAAGRALEVVIETQWLVMC
jgi:hypothetical protein